MLHHFQIISGTMAFSTNFIKLDLCDTVAVRVNGEGSAQKLKHFTCDWKKE